MVKDLKKIAHSVTAIFFVIALTHAPASGWQATGRVLTQMPFEPGRQSPIEITTIKVKGAAVESGQKFSADDDWLRGLTFTVKNISDKPISYVAVGLLFPTPEGSRAKYAAYNLRYGYAPILPETAAAPITVKPIMPGETIDLELSEGEYQILLNFLGRAGVGASVGAAEYDIEQVFFEGDADTTWRHGRLLRRDPLNPRRFNVVERYTLPKKPQ